MNLQPGVDPENRLVSPFVRHIVKDQKHFWTLPGQLRKKDVEWIIPVAGATTALIASDSWLSHQVPNRPGQLSLTTATTETATAVARPTIADRSTNGPLVKYRESRLLSRLSPIMKYFPSGTVLGPKSRCVNC